MHKRSFVVRGVHAVAKVSRCDTSDKMAGNRCISAEAHEFALPVGTALLGVFGPGLGLLK